MAEKTSQEVAKWHDRISVSKKWREQVSSEGNWENYLDELEGKYDVVLGNIQVPPLGEMFAYKDTMVSNLLLRDPYIAVNAKKDASIESAYILEAAINYYWRELNVKEEIELEMTDLLFVGHAWNKVGMNVKLSGSGDQLKMEKDELYSTRVSWRDMLMNVGCKRPGKDNLWIAQRIYVPTDDVKKDYPKFASRLTGSAHPNVEDKMRRNILYKEDFNYSTLYEIHDAREKKIYLIADEINNDYLEDPRPWPEYMDEFPFNFLSLHDIPDKPYPYPDVSSFEPQVKEKIKIFTMMLNHIKRWNRQMVIKMNVMTPTELDKFEKGIDGAILQAKVSGTADIQSAFKMIDFGALPPDIYMALDRIDAQIVRTNGLPAFFQGGNTKTGTRTDGELNKIQSGAESRFDRKRDRVERHIEDIARHMLAHMKNQFIVPTFAKITGNEPPEIIQAFQDQGIYDPRAKMIRFSADDIKGEYDVTVKAGSTVPLDKMNRDKVLDSVLQVGAQMASLPSIPPFIAEVLKERLHDYDMKGLERAFKQQEEAAARQQEQQSMEGNAQQEKVKAEAAKRAAQTQNINVDTLIKGIQATGKATGVLGPEESLV